MAGFAPEQGPLSASRCWVFNVCDSVFVCMGKGPSALAVIVVCYHGYGVGRRSGLCSSLVEEWP